MMRHCTPKNIIKPSPGKQTVRFESGDTKDIITAIIEMDAQADKFISHADAQCLRGRDGYETLRNVFKFVRSNITYRADKPGHEVVKSPAALFDIKRGDCKSYSIAIAALLRSLGFSGIRYRFASYQRGGDFTHVYVVVRHDGHDVIMDAIPNSLGFDREAAYTSKKDIPAASSRAHAPQLRGLGSSITPSLGFIALLSLGIGAYFFTK
jgi:Transglutaminase-like enzymes, putative cysteine proteases